MPTSEQQLEDIDDRSVEPGVWRYAHARRARVVIDGADYFEFIQQAMLKARQRILLIGWDFDTRIHLNRGRRWYEKGFKREYPTRLGSFIVWLTKRNKSLEVRILKWSYSVFSMAQRGSMLFDLARWFRHGQIDFKFDTAHPVGCCHHQKIVVIDDDFAVCGGIDMTTRRWDTREHKEVDKRRTKPRRGLYPPWHDVTMMMEGDVAGALEQLGRSRWVRAGGEVLRASTPTNESAWPDGLEATFDDVEIGIARSRAAYAGESKVDEVEKLFLDQIANARKFIYAENQYFASRTICEAIAKRLTEDDPPEFVIVTSLTADGWLEGKAMDPARSELVKAMMALDEHKRFHIFTPYSGDTPIYVHAKLTIVDDRILRVGSANFNNRSMGLDSECDVFIDSHRPANTHTAPAIMGLRHSLLAEHCGVDEAEIGPLLDKRGSMAAMIAGLGEQNSRRLRPFRPGNSGEIATDMALRQMLDPERPDALFDMPPPKRGLFRAGSLLSRARKKFRAKLRRKKTDKA